MEGSTTARMSRMSSAAAWAIARNLRAQGRVRVSFTANPADPANPAYPAGQARRGGSRWDNSASSSAGACAAPTVHCALESRRAGRNRWPSMAGNWNGEARVRALSFKGHWSQHPHTRTHTRTKRHTHKCAHIHARTRTPGRSWQLLHPCRPARAWGLRVRGARGVGARAPRHDCQIECAPRHDCKG